MEQHDKILLTKTYLISLLIFALVFYKEPFFSTVQLTLSIAAISYIPGYLLTKKVFESPAQSLLFGSALSLSVIAISAYYLGLIGIPLHITSYTLPALLIVTGLFINRTHQ